MFCGCVGMNGGGLDHYVGQEKLAPIEPWASIAFARDWGRPPRLQNAPSWHYVHSDQWRYEQRSPTTTPPADQPRRFARARPHRWTSRSAPCATAGCRSIRSSIATRSTSCRRRRRGGAATDEDVVGARGGRS